MDFSEEQEPLFVLLLRENECVENTDNLELDYLDQLIPDEIESEKITYMRFTELMVEAYQNAIPGSETTLLKEGLIVTRLESGEEWTGSLDNSWRDLKNQPGFRKEMIRPKLAHAQSFMNGSNELDLNKLVLIVRNYDYPLNVDVENQISGSGKNLAPGIDLLLAQDKEHGIQTVSVPQFKACGQDLDALIELGKSNMLNKVLPQEVLIFPSKFNGWLLECDGCYESSLILFEEILGFLQKEAQSKLAFAVPSREILLCCPLVEETLKQFSEFVEESYPDLSYRITQNIFSWDKGAIELLIENDKPL